MYQFCTKWNRIYAELQRYINITANKIKMRYGFWLYRIFYYGNSCSSKKDSMGFFSILDNPYNSISVTVLLPSSILDIEPRQMYTASVSNRLDRFCWLIFCSWRNCFSLAPIILHFWAGVVDSRFIFSPFCLVIGQYLC